MAANTLTAQPAELIKADTALRSFRDGGYILADAVGEMVDNSQQSGATKVRVDWEVVETEVGKTKGGVKTRRQLIELVATAWDGDARSSDNEAMPSSNPANARCLRM